MSPGQGWQESLGTEAQVPPLVHLEFQGWLQGWAAKDSPLISLEEFPVKSCKGWAGNQQPVAWWRRKEVKQHCWSPTNALALPEGLKAGLSLCTRLWKAIPSCWWELGSRQFPFQQEAEGKNKMTAKSCLKLTPAGQSACWITCFLLRSCLLQ
jgi:hypothetical protein